MKGCTTTSTTTTHLLMDNELNYVVCMYLCILGFAKVRWVQKMDHGLLIPPEIFVLAKYTRQKKLWQSHRGNSKYCACSTSFLYKVTDIFWKV